MDLTFDIKVSLPESLAREAESAGLLTPEAIEGLLLEALRKQRSDRFFAVADRLAELEIPMMSAEEIEAEIAAARKEKPLA